VWILTECPNISSVFECMQAHTSTHAHMHACTQTHMCSQTHTGKCSQKGQNKSCNSEACSCQNTSQKLWRLSKTIFNPSARAETADQFQKHRAGLVALAHLAGRAALQVHSKQLGAGTDGTDVFALLSCIWVGLFANHCSSLRC